MLAYINICQQNFFLGKFYIVISRVTSLAELKILTYDLERNVSKTTPNIIYKDDFSNCK